MRIPRYTIGRLMVVVAAICANIGAGRGLAVRNTESCVALALIVASLQLALVAAACGPARYRAFWSAFIALGSLCPLTLLLATFQSKWTGYVFWIGRYLEASINGLNGWLSPILRPYYDVPWIMVPAFALTAFLP